MSRGKKKRKALERAGVIPTVAQKRERDRAEYEAWVRWFSARHDNQGNVGDVLAAYFKAMYPSAYHSRNMVPYREESTP